MTAPKILILESTEKHRRETRRAVENDYFEVRDVEVGAHNPEVIKALLKEESPALIVDGTRDWASVLSLVGPDLSASDPKGSRFQMPFVVIMNSNDPAERIKALDQGVDDVLCRPFLPEELTARIKAILRRAQPHLDSDVVVYKNILLDPKRHFVSVNGEPLKLVLTEFRLLHFFLTHIDFVYSRQQILDAVWGVDRYIDERTVNTYVRRLRSKLESCLAQAEIASVRGVGYQFS